MDVVSCSLSESYPTDDRSIRCVQPNPLNRLGLSEKLKIVTNFLRIEDATPNVLLTNTLALVRYLVIFQSQSLPCRLTKDVPKIFLLWAQDESRGGFTGGRNRRTPPLTAGFHQFSALY